MKRLALVALTGTAGVLLFAFTAKAGFNVYHGRPIAHATGLGASLLRYALVLVIVVFALVVVWLWQSLQYRAEIDAWTGGEGYKGGHWGSWKSRNKT